MTSVFPTTITRVHFFTTTTTSQPSPTSALPQEVINSQTKHHLKTNNYFSSVQINGVAKLISYLQIPKVPSDLLLYFVQDLAIILSYYSAMGVSIS